MTKTKNRYDRFRAEARRMIDGEEGYDVEFKESAKALEAEDIAAFANGDGGTILVGVREISTRTGQKGEIIGSKISDGIKRSILNKANSCRPRIGIHIAVEGVRTKRPIYRVDIPKGEKSPYCTGSGTYKIRKDGQNIGIDPELMVSIILEREEEEFIGKFRSAGNEIIRSLEELRIELQDEINHVASLAEDAVAAAEGNV